MSRYQQVVERVKKVTDRISVLFTLYATHSQCPLRELGALSLLLCEYWK